MRRPLPWLFFLTGLVLALYPMFFSAFARMAADFGDLRLNQYFLEHGYRWLTRDPLHARFWNLPIFFPQSNTAAYSDLMAGLGPLYWVWRIVGIGPDAAMQAFLIMVSFLNYWVAWVWIRRDLKATELGASVGAFLFAFSSVRTAQICHPQLLGGFLMLVPCLAFTRGLTRSWLWASGAALVLQFYTAYYLGWFMVLGIGLFVGWALIMPPTRPTLLKMGRKQWPTLAAVGVVSAALLAPLGHHYLEAGRTVGFRNFAAVDLPSLQSWLYLGNQSWLYGWMSLIKAFKILHPQVEQAIGLGLVTMAVVLSGVWRRRRSPWVHVSAHVAATVILLSSRLPGGFSLWRLVFAAVPGAEGIRALTRIAFLPLLLVGPVVAWEIDRLRKSLATAGLALLIFWIVLEQGRTQESFSLAESRASIQAVASQIGPCASFLYAPSTHDLKPYRIQVDAMWAGIQTGVPTLNGYSGNVPPGWPFEDPRGSQEAAVAAWATLKGLDPNSICRVH